MAMRDLQREFDELKAMMAKADPEPTEAKPTAPVQAQATPTPAPTPTPANVAPTGYSRTFADICNNIASNFNRNQKEGGK